jgi:hypothetical protein
MNNLELSRYKACECGTNVDSEESIANFKFSWLGWFFWTMGTTATPTQISFYCNKCKKIYYIENNIDNIKHFTLYRRK